MTKQVVEALKTALIVLLTASSIFLIGASEVFGELFASLPALQYLSSWLSSGGTHGNVSKPEDPLKLEAAAIPLEIVVTNESGGHFGIKYDDASVKTLYDRISNIFGETLGSAQPPLEITRQEWESALKSAGVYFDFYTDLQLSVLSRWHNQEMLYRNTHQTSRICIAQNLENGIDLYYYCTSEDAFFRCSTAARSAVLMSMLEGYRPNGTAFVFELSPLLGTLDPYSFIPGAPSPKMIINAENPRFNTLVTDTVLSAFKISPYSPSSYPESDGTIVYVESFGTLKITEGGIVTYKAAEREIHENMDTGRMIETARRLLSAAFSGWQRDEELYFAGINEYGDSVYELIFEYYVNGIAVHIKGESAAVVTIEDGHISEVRLCLRSYTVTGEEAILLPETQAAAIAQSRVSGSRLSLVYSDTGSALIEPSWVITD